jgi:hypothetical protein
VADLASRLDELQRVMGDTVVQVGEVGHQSVT